MIALQIIDDGLRKNKLRYLLESESADRFFKSNEEYEQFIYPDYVENYNELPYIIRDITDFIFDMMSDGDVFIDAGCLDGYVECYKRFVQQVRDGYECAIECYFYSDQVIFKLISAAWVFLNEQTLIDYFIDYFIEALKDND